MSRLSIRHLVACFGCLIIAGCSEEHKNQSPTPASIAEFKGTGWKQSNGPRQSLSSQECAYWMQVGSELLVKAGPETRQKVAAAPFSVIVVEAPDQTIHFEFLQMTQLESAGVTFRAKTSDGWRTKFVEGTKWEELLRMSALPKDRSGG